MGYHTDFTGRFTVEPQLTLEHAAYLKAFSQTRRMRRDARAAHHPDPVREAAGIKDAGLQGGYFVGAGGHCGQVDSPDVVDYNNPPRGQPGLWCQWVPTEDGKGIEWDEGEKFYDYEEWLEYIIGHFLEPWGYTVTGEVEWSGDEQGDVGVLVVKSNVVTTRKTL